MSKDKDLHFFTGYFEPPRLFTDLHSTTLLAAYQVMVDHGLFTQVVINTHEPELLRRLYPKVASSVNLVPDERTGGSIIKPKEKHDT